MPPAMTAALSAARRPRAFTLPVILTLLFLADSEASLAQGVGAIAGSVSDASGAVLPGVAVTLSNPGTIGGSQETVTDERGAYQFVRLVPGRYSVRGQLTGFRPVVISDIVVNAAATARADIQLELGDVSESITVSGQAPLLDTTTGLNQTVMDRQVLDTLPGTNDLWGIARVVPSIVMNKYDVGGSESFQQSKITVHGSNPNGESQYQIDGMNIDAAVGATGNVTMYYDPFMFEEINYQTSNGSAENTRGGIVYNMITKTGSNAFRGSFMANGSNQNFQSNNLTPELRRDLLAAVPARALAANPNIVPGAKILHIFDTGGTISGLALRDRLWLVGTVKSVGLDQLRPSSCSRRLTMMRCCSRA
ncbi:MAG: carboxypeptidase regulatory-like domain-containing protein [Acidimicrobiia bacterium]|nr:carboxypeptidase regulatory-like domain-containing protein [Acidimicrobiia bacterium]